MSSRKREIESPEDCRRVITLISSIGTENFQFKRDLVIPMQVYIHTLQTTEAPNHCGSFRRMHDLARTLARAEYACGSMPV
ncbi:hypothetical protein M0R45_037942 [Rubus argutus]|uniref:Uncharacterized protein n=1 Tax=Rubus argutus TaxID=59490 RepID=A0AAW1W3V2_RUBAR